VKAAFPRIARSAAFLLAVSAETILVGLYLFYG